MTAPDNNRRRIAELVHHRPGLAHGVIGEGGAIIITPLQRDILPNHESHLIGHLIQRAARHVAMNADGVGVHRRDQSEIPEILFPRHGAQPRRANIVAALDEQPSVIDAPALIIRQRFHLT